jgi:hypothetical protein
MGNAEVGAANLAAFVAATAGRRGESAEIRGGSVTASPVSVASGYINAAVPIDIDLRPDQFLDDALDFFTERRRSFVLWVPASLPALMTEAVARGGVQSLPPRVAMETTRRVTRPGRFDMRSVSNDEEARLFGSVAESAFQLPGLSTLLLVHDSFRGVGTEWVVAYDGLQPLAVACAYLNGTTGGLYFACTLAEHRGRGAAADLTGYLSDHLFDQGAERIVVQSLEPGAAACEHLGFVRTSTYELFTWELR